MMFRQWNRRNTTSKQVVSLPFENQLTAGTGVLFFAAQLMIEVEDPTQHPQPKFNFNNW